ncbi:hypothetical protein SLA2020_425970 [Shorea laevis]
MCWWVFTGLVHTILDSFYVFSPIFYKNNTGSTLSKIWKEYSKADSRYAVRYSDIIMLEGLFAATGPVCFLALYAMAKGKSFSTILQFAISLVHICAISMLLITYILDGDNFAASDYYYYEYHIGINALWVLIAPQIALRCWKKISEACLAQDQKKNKVP